jgi:hypothetical protein
MKKEFEIFNEIQKGNPLSLNKFDYLKFYFDDLEIHNEIIIEYLKLGKLIKDVYNLASDLMKLSVFNIEFNKYDDLLMVITCILGSYKLLKKIFPSKFKNYRVKTFFKEWIINITQNSEYQNIQIKDCYLELNKFYFDNRALLISKSINKRLI